MTCGQAQLGGCDLDLTHPGPCVVDGKLSKSARARMPKDEAEYVLKSQLRNWADPPGPLGRNIPEQPPGAVIYNQSQKKYKQPKESAMKGANLSQTIFDEISFDEISSVTSSSISANALTNPATITVQAVGNGKFVSMDPASGRAMVWTMDGWGRLTLDGRADTPPWEDTIVGTWAERPVHPALPWVVCGDNRIHRPHRGLENTSNCPGRTKGWAADRSDGSWRSWAKATEYLKQNPIPAQFQICTCGCACECDGQIHFTDELCACFYLGCACVQDKPDEALVA